MQSNHKGPPQIWTAAPIHVRDFVSPCPDPRGPSARRSEMVGKQPLFAGAESGTILLGLGFELCFLHSRDPSSEAQQ